MKSSSSIVKSMRLRGYFASFIFFICICIGPIVLYDIYVSEKEKELYDYVSVEEASARESLLYAYSKGYGVSLPANDINYILSSGEICDPVSTMKKEGKFIVLYTNGCDEIVYTVSSEVLKEFIKILILYGTLTLILILAYNIGLMKLFELRISKTVDNIIFQVNSIRSLELGENDQVNGLFYSEFEEVFQNIINTTKNINAYINERKVMTETLNHELKTPLNKITSLIQAYSFELPGYDDEEVLFEQINKSIEVLLNIIDFSLKLFANQGEEETNVEISVILERLIDSRKEELVLKNLTILRCYDQEFTVLASERNIELVLSNLVSNAIKYSESDTCISIDILENEFKITNKVDSEKSSGTQLGIKLSTQILNMVNLDLSYQEENSTFQVLIKKRNVNCLPEKETF